MTKILITGAHGFIGKHLSKFLAAKGHQVMGIGHGSWVREEALSWGIQEWLDGDINQDNLRILQERGEPELVFHLAGGSTVGAAIKNPYEDFLRTVQSSIELLEWIRLELPTVRLIAISSAAIYGATFNRPIPENAIGTPYSPYGYHKQIMESVCKSYGDSYGIDFRIARLFSVYGPELKKQLLWDICKKLKNSNSNLILGGTGEELRDWVHIKDVTAALELIGFNNNPNQSNYINVGSGIGTSVKQVAEIVINAWQKHTGKTIKSNFSFSNQNRPGDPFSLIAEPLSLAHLGFSAKVSLDEGIHEYVKWFYQLIKD